MAASWTGLTRFVSPPRCSSTSPATFSRETALAHAHRRRGQRRPAHRGIGWRAAGVELAFDLTQHAVIGLSDVLKNYLKFRRLFHQLLKLAIEEQPDAIIGV